MRMNRPRRTSVALIGAVAVATTLAPCRVAAAESGFTLEQVKSLPFPGELTAAGQRLAWTFNESGRRNVWVAEGPGFEARKLTDYDRDDGQELTSLAFSKDGSRLVYVRGGDHGTNWDAGPPNPESLPVPPKVEIWSVPFEGGPPSLLAEGDDPAISPRGDVVAYLSGGQAFVAPIDGQAPGKRLFAAKGTTRELRWSPDGSRLAFVSSRGDHAFVGVFTSEGEPLRWIAPTTSRDGSPRWSPDGTRLVFVRRPGDGGPPEPMLEARQQPWALWTADVESGAARRLWQSPGTPRGSLPTTHGGVNLHWAAGERIVFLSYVDGWPHLYSIASGGGEPLLLTPGEYMAEHVQLSPDGRFLVFAGNAGADPDDIDRRHVVKAPVDRASPEVVTPGRGLEWSPVVLGDGSLAYLAATAQEPPLPTLRPASGGAAIRIGAERVPADFPAARLLTPRKVVYKASDGVTVHAQLFERGTGAARKPAVIFVHGGPPRQMLLGWHYSSYYSNAYALNQYLASRGFVVLSVNYRLGIGYGHDFHRPANAGWRGASEYLDVKAAAEWLRAQPGVDGAKIGIWGGSYGGYLTALALARDSGLFATGVDIHGVHDFTADAARRLGGADWRYEKNDFERAAEVAWNASPLSSLASWRSPVLLIHGDDDRNVRFSQTVDLARRLEARGVELEELVIPDDTHHFLKHANWLRVDAATAAWFERKLMGKGGR